MSYIDYLDSILIPSGGKRVPFIHCMYDYIWGNDGRLIFNCYINEFTILRDIERNIIESAMKYRLSRRNDFHMSKLEADKYIECMTFLRRNRNYKYVLELDEMDGVWYVLDYELKVIGEPKNDLTVNN